MTIDYAEPLIPPAARVQLGVEFSGGQLSAVYLSEEEARSAKPSATTHVMGAYNCLQVTRNKAFDFNPEVVWSRAVTWGKQVHANAVSFNRGEMTVRALPKLDENGRVSAEVYPVSTVNIEKCGTMIFLANEIKKMAERRKTPGESRGAAVTNRELFYKLQRISDGDSVATDRAVAKLASLLKVPVRAFSVQKTRTGRIFGPVFLDYGDGEVFDCRKTRAHPDGYDVPPNLAEIILGIETPEYPPRVCIDANVKVAIVAEAGGIAKRLMDDKVWEKYPVVCTCTGGNTDDDTNVFVNVMNKGFGLPVWYIVDGDNGGLVVMNSPHCCNNRNERCEYEDLFSGIDTNLLGICAQDYGTLGMLKEDVKIEAKKMSEEYKGKIRKTEKSGLYEHGNIEVKKAHVEAMLKHGYKVQCEWVATEKFWEYFEEKLRKITGITN